MIDRAMKPFVKPFNCHFALTTIGYEKKNTAFLLVRIQLLVVKKLDSK